jgi:CheY-like chemotaxis protein
MEQVLLNLCINAWQAMPEGGDLYLRTENVVFGDKESAAHHVPAGRYVKLSVTDTGRGMDKVTQERIFEPFFTTRSMGHGTGLGLASVYGIVANHGGCITVQSDIGRGSTFQLFLPASSKAPVRESKEESRVLGGSETLLVVDDEQMLRRATRRLLDKLGYQVLVASGGEEALAIYRQNPEIAAVILDMIMPGMSGAETFDRLKQLNPGVRVLLTSGYAMDRQAQDILDSGCRGFVQKPYDLSTLAHKLRETIEH